uniref:EF-hand domain-containing protein n=1 Tax=Meloidogyne floridensis TaxID=298350 RepID=A0A915NZ03_9BILA
MKEWRSSEGNVPLERFLPCRGLVVNGMERKDYDSLVENGCFRIDTHKSSPVFELKANEDQIEEKEKEESFKDFVSKEEYKQRTDEGHYDDSLRKEGEKEDKEQREDEIEDEDWDEDENDEETEDEAYLSPWSSRRSDRSTPLSQCSTSTATFIMNLPVPTGAELPPSASSYHHNNREEWRHSSPVDKLLVVDEVHFTFRLFTSTPSTSSPRNSKENTENADSKQSPRWRADSLNEALPAFKKDQQPQKQQILPSVIDQKQRLSTSLENTSSSPANESLLHIGKTEQNSILPLIEPPTTTNTSSSLPLILTEKRKINIAEDNNKYLNGFALNNNNDEVISSTFLPQTVIQTSALQAFSSSLSPPPCYQQAANSLRLSPIAGRLAGIPRAVYDACCRMNNLTSIPPSSITQTENDQNLKDSHKIDFNQFIIYWNRMCAEAHDEATKFIFTLNAATRPFNSHCLRKEDFLPILMDLILTHPGLHFLKEAPQFYSKYCEVVIVRIFWNVNRSWSGRITASELRRSNFLQTFRMLDDITDINRITDYFSYEHFYVTYCKFWELDTDHDMVISRDDMKRHCNGALTDRIIDRIFSAAVLRTPSEQKTISGQGPVKQQPIETIGFEDFVCFLLAEEDKRHPTSVEYWFRCIDLDGDGQISLYEMEYFYEAIEQKLNSKNMETLALRDVICNLLDSISSSNGYSITRSDLKRSGLAHRFFNTFVNWIKYVDQESSDGERASVKTTGDKEISDWEVFCLTEYELLMSESEQISNEEEEEDGVEDENIDLVLDEDDELESSLTSALLNEERDQRLHGFLQHQQKQQQQSGHLTA